MNGELEISKQKWKNRNYVTSREMSIGEMMEIEEHLAKIGLTVDWQDD